MQNDSWQSQLSRAISDPEILLDRLELPKTYLQGARSAARQFPLRVTHHYLSLIEKGKPHDPLLRQVLPLEDELAVVPGFVSDPVGDNAARHAPGILQKYQGRALLLTTGACAIHCRYCFRRHFPYAEEAAIRHWEKIPETLRANPKISEIILSGGDPLTLSDQRLADLIQELGQLPQLKRLRIHTRLPSVLPTRITTRLLEILELSRLRVSLVMHCNHARELSPPLGHALEALRQAGVLLLNQSVLLKGVNDTADSLIDLSETLYDHGILPYYLHALDPVAGSAHFKISDDRARALHRQLLAQLPGYLVPRLVREIAGQASKTPIS